MAEQILNRLFFIYNYNYTEDNHNNIFKHSVKNHFDLATVRPVK